MVLQLSLQNIKAMGHYHESHTFTIMPCFIENKKFYEVSNVVLTQWGWDKMTAVCRYFQIHLLYKKIVVFW